MLGELRATFAAEQTHLPRGHVELDAGRGNLLLMPAVAARTAGVKLVTVRAHGRRTAVQGIYVLFDTERGSVVATMDGAALTALRTPAVSAVATDALARPDVRRLAVFGTGVQAREHVRAMRWVRPSLERVEIVGRDPASTDRFVAMLRGEGHPAVAATAELAASADLICTCTSSADPVLPGDAVMPGAHLNAVGSYLPDRRELGESLLAKARVVVDDIGAARLESGDLVHAVGAGAMSWSDVVGDLSGVARGTVVRESPGEVTVFVSVGLAARDLTVATLAARRAGLLLD